MAKELTYSDAAISQSDMDIMIQDSTIFSPKVIEDTLLRHEAVDVVAVIGLSEQDLCQVPVACIESSSINPLMLNDLNRHIIESLTPVHRLKDVFEFYRLPRIENGKIDREALLVEIKRLNKYRSTGGKTFRCEDSVHLKYIERTHYYYSQLGFGKPYEWDRNAEIPFSLLTKPLSKCSVAIVTTASFFQADKGEQGPGASYNSFAKFYEVYSGEITSMPDLRISHIAIDRDNTSADDIGTYFPLTALKQAAIAGRIGAVAAKFYGLPTNRSKRITNTIDCQSLLAQCKSDGVDAVILVPNCPVCHQSVTLAARTLETAGISTVVMGCARDIVEAVGAPRFVFSDFPLGNSAGRPSDPQSQHIVLSAALDLLESARTSGAFKQSPLRWIGKENWKSYYSNPDLLSSKEIAVRRMNFDAAKATAKALREDVGK